MKSYHNIRSSRSSVKNIQIIQGGQDLTAQAGLIPVVKFLKKHGFASKIEQTMDHQRGAHWSLRRSGHDSIAPGRNYWGRTFGKFDSDGLE